MVTLVVKVEAQAQDQQVLQPLMQETLVIEPKGKVARQWLVVVEVEAGVGRMEEALLHHEIHVAENKIIEEFE